MRFLCLSVLVLLISCGSKAPNKAQLIEGILLPLSQSAFFSTSKQTLTSTQNSAVNGEVFRLKFTQKKQWYKVKVKGRKSLFGQRKWQLFVVKNSSDSVVFKNWEALANHFRSKGLMCFSYHWTQLLFSDGTTQKVFLKSYPSAHFLEKNRKKEGQLFCFKKDGSIKLLNQMKGDFQLSKKAIAAAKQLINEQFIDLNYFDSAQVNLTLACISELNQQVAKEEFLFYHNPLSGKLELVFQPKLMGSNWKPAFEFKKEAPGGFPKKYFKLDAGNKQLSLRIPHTILHELVELPAVYHLKLNKGDRINLKPEAGLIINGGIVANGTKEQPILIQGEKGNQGFQVIRPSISSQLKHVHFGFLESHRSNQRNLSGAVTFYQTKVEMDSCVFTNNDSEDALHLFNVDFILRDLVFKGCISDGIDADFSSGELFGIQASQIGNDAIDVSGSVIHVENLYLTEVKDKALSIGEKSEVEGRKIWIENSNLAMAVKDSSRVNLVELNLNNNVLLYAVYQKKPEYGPAILEVRQTVADNNEEAHLVEKASKLIVNGNLIQGKMSDVRRYFKAEEYGGN